MALTTRQAGDVVAWAKRNILDFARLADDPRVLNTLLALLQNTPGLTVDQATIDSENSTFLSQQAAQQRARLEQKVADDHNIPVADLRQAISDLKAQP